MLERGEVLAPEEVAAHWYDEVYLPGIDAVRSEGLVEACGCPPEGDLYLWVHQRRRQVMPESGLKPFQEDARCFKEELLARRRRLGASLRARGPRAQTRAAGRA
jgi:hypothetical protein